MSDTKRKSEILKKSLIEQATKNIDDPKALKHYIDRIEKMSELGFHNMVLNSLKSCHTRLNKIFKAQEPLFNLITSILQSIETKHPSVFKKSVADLSDNGIKFAIGSDAMLDETDSVGRVLKCIFNEAIFGMMRDASETVYDLAGGIDTLDTIINISEKEYEELASEFVAQKYPKDVQDEIDKVTKDLVSKREKGETKYEA